LDSPNALLDQFDLVDRALSQDARQQGLRPGVRSSSLGALAQLLPESRVPPIVTSWFRWHDGQTEDAGSLHPVLDWRMLSGAEAAAALAKEGAERGVPVFVDRGTPSGVGLVWLTPGAYPHESPLRDHEGQTVEAAPHLGRWLEDVVRALGVDLSRPRASLSLGPVLEELLALLAQPDGDFEPLRPPAPRKALEDLAARILGTSPLPPALETWFALHDGQAPVPEPRWGAGLHPRQRRYALGAREALAAWEGLQAARPCVPFSPTCVPLFTSEQDTWVTMETTGPNADELIWVRTAPTVLVEPLGQTLTEWLAGATQRRRALREDRARTLPEGYRPTVAQQRVIALGGILYHRSDEPVTLLGGAPRLLGASAAFAGQARWWRRTTPSELRALLEELIADTDPERDARDSDAVAWDLVRASAAAGRGYVAGLLELEEAFAYCLRAARLAQARVSSWEALVSGYALRYREWRGDDAAPIEHSLAELLARGGPFEALPWDMSLDDVPAPALPGPRIVRVSPRPDADPQSRGLMDAIRDARPGDRLLLAPGVYESAPLRLGVSVELVASAPGVVLAPRGLGAAVVVAGASVFLDGIHIRAQGGAHHAPADGVHVEEGFLRLSGCRVEAARIALGVAHHEQALVVRSELTGHGATGVHVAEHGQVALVDCVVCDCATGVEVRADATLTMEGGEVARSDGNGVVVSGGNLRMTGVEVHGCGLTAVGLTGCGESRVVDCVLRDNASVTVLVSSEASCAFRNVSFLRSGAGHLQILDSLESTFTGCRFEDCAQSAVLLRPGDGAQLLDCSIARSGMAAVLATGEAADSPSLSRCRIEGHNDAGPVFATEGAWLSLDDCALIAGEVVAAEASGHATLQLTGTTVEAAAGALFAHHGGAISMVGGRMRSGAGHGALVTDAASLYMNDVELRSAGAAVALGGGSRAGLYHCRIIQPGSQGILCDAGTSAMAYECRFEGTGEEAVYALAGSRLVLEGCTAHECGDLVLRLESADVLVTRCSFEDGKSAGVGAFGETALWVRDTSLARCAAAGVEAADNARIWLDDVVVSEAGENGLLLCDSAQATVRGGTLGGGSEFAVKVDDQAAARLINVTLVAGTLGAGGGSAVQNLSRTADDTDAPLDGAAAERLAALEELRRSEAAGGDEDDGGDDDDDDDGDGDDDEEPDDDDDEPRGPLH
jgi:hypothetical protein